MAKKFILGNWKMNGSQASASALASEIAKRPAYDSVQVVLFPPATLLHSVFKQVQSSHVSVGAQDCSPEKDGAFTGDISATQLKDLSCAYVIVGHSERRTHHAESSAVVKRKAQAAIAAGLIPVICVGESLAERESGKYIASITQQIKESLPALVHSEGYIIAYEPVWAIGSGKTPTTQEIAEVHKTIASLLSYGTSGAASGMPRTMIVYGGSVKASCAQEILAIDGVDGVLVGGASLNATEFGKIIECAVH